MPTGLGLGLKLQYGGQLWSPSELGASLLGWWDAEDASTITASGGAVSSWRDKVAAYDAAQTTGASKPTYSATSFNSRPGLTFDGADDYLNLESVPFPTGATASEIWALVDQGALVADTTTRFVFTYGDAASLGARALRRAVVTGANVARLATGNGVGATFSDSAADFSGRHVLRGAVGATQSTITADGGTGVSQTVTPATTSTRTQIGASGSSAAVPAQFFQGVISAILVTGALTTAQAAQLTTYLKTRGGIA